MQTTQPTSFLSLPAELRITIYEITFTGLKIDRRLAAERIKSKRKEEPIGILMSSKQIHEEAMPVFYRCASFWSTFGSQNWADWLFKLPAKHRKTITEIRLRGQVLWCGAAEDALAWHTRILQQNGVELRQGVIWAGAITGDGHEVWQNEFWQHVDRFSVDGVYERTELASEEFDLWQMESESFYAMEDPLVSILN